MAQIYVFISVVGAFVRGVVLVERCRFESIKCFVSECRPLALRGRVPISARRSAQFSPMEAAVVNVIRAR